MGIGEIISLALTACTILISIVAVCISIREINNQNKLNLLDRRIEILRKIENIENALAFGESNIGENIGAATLDMFGMKTDGEELKEYLTLIVPFFRLCTDDVRNKLCILKSGISVDNFAKDLELFGKITNDGREAYAIFDKDIREYARAYFVLYGTALMLSYVEIFELFGLEDTTGTMASYIKRNVVPDVDAETMREYLKQHSEICKEKNVLEKIYRATSIYKIKKKQNSQINKK